MAFPVASNYNNLPNGVFVPSIFSKKVQKQFRKSSVVEGITNSAYFGEISAFGDTVHILLEPEIEVKPYRRGTQINPQDLVDQDYTLTVDRSNYFSFKMDDIEDKQSHVDWMSMASDRAAYRMKDHYDRDILGYMTGYDYNDDTGLWTARTAPVGTKANTDADADELLGTHKLDAAAFGGTAGNSIAIGTSGTYTATPLRLLSRLGRMMDQLNVDTDGRWVVVDPVFMEMLRDEDSKFMNHDYQTTENLTNGQVVAGTVRGFRLYESNNLVQLGTGSDTVDTDGSDTNYGVIVAGHDSAVATAQQMQKTEKYRDPDSFADIVRGMDLYGRKILRPEALFTAKFNVNR